MKKTRSIILTVALALACVPLVAVRAASADGIYQSVADVKNHMPDPNLPPNGSDPNRMFISFNQDIIRNAIGALIQSNKTEPAFTDDDKFVVQAASVTPGSREQLYAICKLAPSMMARTMYLNISDADYATLKANNYQWNGVDVHFLADQLAVKFNDPGSMNPDRSGFLLPNGFYNDSLRTPLYKSYLSTLVAGKTEPQTYTILVEELEKLSAVRAAHPEVANVGPFKTLFPWVKSQRDFAYRHMKATGQAVPGE